MSTINKTVEEFVDRVEREGIQKTEEVYGVSEIVNELREIAVFRSDNKIELPEMLEGARLNKHLEESELMDLADLGRFISEVYKRAKSKEMSVSTVIDQCKVLSDLEKEFGEFGKIKNEWADIGSDLPAKKNELREIHEQIKTARKSHSELLSKNSADERTLKEYVDVKNSLLKFGLDLEELDKSTKFLVEVKNLRYNARRMIEKFTSIDDLEMKKSGLTRELDESKKSLASLQNQVRTVQKELSEKSEELDEARKLTENGIEVEQVQNLRALAVRIGAGHGESPRKAWIRLVDDLQNYDTRLGFQPEVTSLEKKIELLKEENDSLDEVKSASKRDIDDLEKAYAKQKNVIEAYTALSKLGISGITILQWQKIIRDAKLNPAVIEAELLETSVLAKSKEAIEAEVAEQQKKRDILQSEFSELKAEKEELEAAIHTVQSKGIEEIETLSSKALSRIGQTSDKVKTSLTELEAKASKISDSVIKSLHESTTTAMNEYKSDISEALEINLDKARNTSKELNDILEKAQPQILTVSQALDAGIEFGKYETLLPLLEMYKKGEGKEEKVLPTLTHVLEQFENWSDGREWEIKTRSPLSELLSVLREEVHKID